MSHHHHGSRQRTALHGLVEDGIYGSKRVGGNGFVCGFRFGWGGRLRTPAGRQQQEQEDEYNPSTAAPARGAVRVMTGLVGCAAARAFHKQELSCGLYRRAARRGKPAFGECPTPAPRRLDFTRWTQKNPGGYQAARNREEHGLKNPWNTFSPREEITRLDSPVRRSALCVQKL